MDVGELRLIDNKGRLETRIRSATKKSKQRSLPSNSKSINQSKFERNGKDGPLVVFAEELSYPFRNFGNYNVVKKYKPREKIHSDNIAPTKRSKARVSRAKKDLMLNEKDSGNLADSLSENSDFEVHNSFHKELRLPKLKSGSTRQEEDHRRDSSSGDSVSNLEYSKNTELPKLPAQEYIDNFRRDAAEFEQRLSASISRASTDRKLLNGKTRDSTLPKIEEKGSGFLTSTDKLLVKDDHFHLPKLQHRKEAQDGLEIVNKKKRKGRNDKQKKAVHQDSWRSMSHSERKAAAHKKQAKWSKITMQSNTYI